MGQVVAGQVVAGQVVAGQVAVVPLIYSEKVTFWDFFDFVTKCVTEKLSRVPCQPVPPPRQRNVSS
jgi:hypothetical protein